jgi:Ser/Thr protein kinase RdoA (MazF antagonist)
VNDGKRDLATSTITARAKEAPKAAALDAANTAALAWSAGAKLEPLGQGHIHETYRLTDPSHGTYVLQRINEAVYQNIGLLMAQTQLVLGTLADEPSYLEQYQVPQLVPTKSGSFLFKQQIQGVTTCWRMWGFVEDSRTCDPPENRQQIRLAAKAFGAYQRALETLAPHQLEHTIPNFLHMSAYLEQFDAVLGTADAEEITQAQQWIRLVQSHRQWPEALTLPNALIHGDCKINNALFDSAGAQVLAIIDLDNNMRGHWAWDFGDLVRSVSYSRGGFDPEDYRACVDGFAAGKGQRELDSTSLVQAPGYLAYMLGLRFLTDHLAGDRYFSVPGHGVNLQRAQEQFTLFQDFQANRLTMAAIVAE